LEHKDVDRLIGFTDAAMAIVITLLMLDIRLPGPADEMSNGELWHALLSIWPACAAYAGSFLVIGLYWLSHREKFRWILRANTAVVWLNILFLLVLGLVPFVTSLLAENAGFVSTMLYAAVMALDSAILVILWLYATRAGLLAPNIDPMEWRRNLWRSLYAMAVFAVSIPVAWFHANIAKALWVLLVLRVLDVIMLPGRKARPDT
jgi:uncharacterized membrane protein